MIPAKEMEHWDAAVAGLDEAALRSDVPGEPPPQSPQDLALHAQLVGEAREMKRCCPQLWEILDVMTRPSAHEGPLMQASLALSAGETLIYRAGQDSVGQWLRSLEADVGPVGQPQEAGHG